MPNFLDDSQDKFQQDPQIEMAKHLKEIKDYMRRITDDLQRIREDVDKMHRKMK